MCRGVTRGVTPVGHWAAGSETGRVTRGAPLPIMFADLAFPVQVVAVVIRCATGLTPINDVCIIGWREVM